MGKWISAVILVGSLLTIASPSEAYLQKGLFRLGLDTTIFRFSVVNHHLQGPDEREFRNVTVGAGLPMAGINLGGTIVKGLVLGGRITIGRNGNDQFFDDDHYFVWSVLPYLEYVFMYRVFRPFVTVMAGVEGVANYRNDDVWWWGFHAAGGGGAHFFVRHNISIDLTLLAGFVVGGGERRDREKFNHWRFYTSVLFGLSGWF